MSGANARGGARGCGRARHPGCEGMPKATGNCAVRWTTAFVLSLEEGTQEPRKGRIRSIRVPGCSSLRSWLPPFLASSSMNRYYDPVGRRPSRGRAALEASTPCPQSPRRLRESRRVTDRHAGKTSHIRSNEGSAGFDRTGSSGQSENHEGSKTRRSSHDAVRALRAGSSLHFLRAFEPSWSLLKVTVAAACARLGAASSRAAPRDPTVRRRSVGLHREVRRIRSRSGTASRRSSGCRRDPRRQRRCSA